MEQDQAPMQAARSGVIGVAISGGNRSKEVGEVNRRTSRLEEGGAAWGWSKQPATRAEVDVWVHDVLIMRRGAYKVWPWSKWR